jgi:hypothetical protein
MEILKSVMDLAPAFMAGAQQNQAGALYLIIVLLVLGLVRHRK